MTELRERLLKNAELLEGDFVNKLEMPLMLSQHIIREYDYSKIAVRKEE
jgi:hypothetical protein